MNILAYADSIVLIGKNEIEIRQIFVERENITRKLGPYIKQQKTKYMIVEWKNSSKQNKIGQLTIKNYTFERVENFKYLRITLNEDKNHQIVLCRTLLLTISTFHCFDMYPLKLLNYYYLYHLID